MFYEFESQRSIYHNILEHFMLPSADKFYGHGGLLFQQDLTPVHSAWIPTADHNIVVLDWPADSPDKLKPCLQ